MRNLIIEIDIDPSGPSIMKLLPTFKEIQKHNPLLISGEFTKAEIRKLLNTLSPRGLCVNRIVKTLEEGKVLMKNMKERNL